MPRYMYTSKHRELKSTFDHIELRAKLLDYYLRSNRSNINQYITYMPTAAAEVDVVVTVVAGCFRTCSHIICKCVVTVVSHVNWNEAFYTWMSHGAYEQVVSHWNESCHLYDTSHVTREWFILLTPGPVAYIEQTIEWGANRHGSFMYVCGMTHSYVWHDSFMCVTWLIHKCDMTHSCVWHSSINTCWESAHLSPSHQDIEQRCWWRGSNEL